MRLRRQEQQAQLREAQIRQQHQQHMGGSGSLSGSQQGGSSYTGGQGRAQGFSVRGGVLCEAAAISDSNNKGCAAMHVQWALLLGCCPGLLHQAPHP